MSKSNLLYQVENFLQVLAPFQGKRILVLCHDDADSDALGAAAVLAKVLQGEVGVPVRVSEHARELQSKLQIPVVFRPDPSEFDLSILVDTASAQQLPDCMPDQYLLVDHHGNNELVEDALAAVYLPGDSTCQLIWKICQAMEVELSGDMALALGAGILGDTRYMATAATSTIADMAEILAAGNVTYGDLLKVFEVTRKIEREVRLQAAFSAQLHNIGLCMVASTIATGNYVYYIAMMLLELGADISVVGYRQQQNTYIRIAKNTSTAPDLDLYSALEQVVSYLPHTNLWGSSDYAGFNGEGDVEAIIDGIVQQLEQRMAHCQCTAK